MYIHVALCYKCTMYIEAIFICMLQREMKVQHQLYEANNRESANRQENLRLQRLAGQLHMQKKALDHREFDLENFHNDRPGVLDEQRAELRERLV